MLNDLKRSVCQANRDLHQKGLVKGAWGCVSGFDPSMGLFVIKPSGVPLHELQPEQMIVMSMDGQKVEGRLQPSRVAETHRAVYMAWPMTVGAIAQVPSSYATAFAQAGLPIPVYGVIHAEYYCGTIPISREMTKEEVEGDYGYKMGELITATAEDPQKIPAVLLRGHSPFVWGNTPREVVQFSVILEELASMTYITRGLNPNASEIPDYLRDRRYVPRAENTF